MGCRIDGDVDRRHQSQARRCPGAGCRVRVHRRVRRGEGPRVRRGSDLTGRHRLDRQELEDGARLRARRPGDRQGERQVAGSQGPVPVRRVRPEGPVASQQRPDAAGLRGGVGGQGDDPPGDRARRPRRGAGAMVPGRAARGFRKEGRVEARRRRRPRRRRRRITRRRRRRPLPPGRHARPHRAHASSLRPIRRLQGRIKQAEQTPDAHHEPNLPRRPRRVHRRRARGGVLHVTGGVQDGDGSIGGDRRGVQHASVGREAGHAGRRRVPPRGAGEARPPEENTRRR